MNIPDEDFEDEFSLLGQSIGGDIEILDKLKELCSFHHYDAAAICEHWMAFVHSKKITTKLSVENLDLMEREKSKGGSKGNKTSAKINSSTIYNVNSLQQIVDNDADDLLDAYTTPNSKKSKKRQHTPEMVQNKRLTGLSRSPAVPFSPTSYSPSVPTPSQKYSNRKDQNKVLHTLGATEKADWRSRRSGLCKIKPYDEATGLPERFKYMFQKMTDKAHVLNDLIEDVGETIKSHHNIGDFSHIALPVQDTVTACGRVCCDGNGKLNAQSVMLEGSRQTSAGKQISIDLSAVPQYSLFPGQIVAVEGMNSTGNRFVVKKFYESVPPEDPPMNNILVNGDLTAILAAGPYATTDTNDYSPLYDLLAHVKNTSPDLCILLGPFIDMKHPDLEKHQSGMSFEQQFNELLTKIANETSRTNTRVVIVPSQRDVHADFVYPQPPFRVNQTNKGLGLDRIHFASDPCTLTVDGVVFGITSTDILFHLGAEEISYNPPGQSDRLARLAKTILTQQSYYPMYPPNEEVNIDYELFEEHARLPVKPHLLIVPSDLRQFIKDIDGCCCVNFGRLTRGQTNGSYCRLQISAPGNAPVKSFASLVTAEVLRI